MKIYISKALAIAILAVSPWLMANKPLRIDGPHSDRVHYTKIQAELDADEHRVDASMTLRWTNKTSQTFNEIPFHLYLNAFSSTETTFMQETNGGQLRGDRREGDSRENFGYVKVLELTDEKGSNIIDQWSMDVDIAKLTLSQPLEPGQTITLNFKFESQLPKVFARSGHNGETFNFVAQWFPKPSVWYKGRWVNHRYHAHSEFFADFGVYDVSLTVPKSYKVGATGVRVNSEEDEEKSTHHYRAEDVHDFVWTADKNFGEASKEWNGLTVRLLYQKPLDDESIQHQLDSAIGSFKWFDSVVGPYPYSTMTLVQPPSSASGASGMEYPTLVTTITNIEKSSFQEMAAMVTVHEVGHNYWQGILASNEFEESWMDEGINSYTEGRIMEEGLNMPALMSIGDWQVNMPMMHRIRAAASQNIDPVNTNSWSFIDSRRYGSNSYSKPATILNTAERYWGKATVDQLLANYYRAWAFKHPTTEDFLTVAREINPEMADFLNRAINTTQGIDLKIHKISSRKMDTPAGFDLAAKEVKESFKKPEETDKYRNEVILLRNGELFPKSIDVRLVYEDGTTEYRKWELLSDRKWSKWLWESDQKLVEAMVDPKFTWLLDLNYTNNIQRVSSESNETWRWSLPLAQALQNITTTLFVF
ncbi:M1 family metallopeptidase [Pleionea sediminis]|uniref:M1 family metallopeptidase n=1 Tax=Pleionea sediminis TaxID=2569479 RepID=UPI001184EF47|nr:M1 family metallopeptidase [Pleionea sediminis]